MQIYKKLAKAYRCGCPLVSLECSDPAATNKSIVEAFDAFQTPVHVVAWDCARGLYKFKQSTQTSTLAAPTEYVGNPLTLLLDSAKLEQDARMVIVLHNMHKFLGDFQVVQAIWNLRDQFKTTNKMLVMLTGGGRIPPELQNDVVSLIEPLPDADQLADVIGATCDAAEMPATPEIKASAGTAALGITAFAAENLASLAIDKTNGLSLDGLWESKKKKINETPGLQVVSGGSLDAIGGVKQAKTFIRQVLKGRNAPRAIVFIDEIEKALASAGTDMSGTTQDQLGTILSWMQDHRATGCILVGPPGAVKSAFSKAAGSEASIPTIQLDLGASKGSLVGQSEQQIRDALAVVHAVSGGETLWMATCNSITSLPPELKRRFKLGTWFFDLPDAEERAEIWQIYRAKYGLTEEQIAPLAANPWTGAEIESCCELAWKLNIEPVQSAEYIVPVSIQAAESIERLRAGAEGRFLSASYPGTYARSRPSAVAGRKFEN